MAQTAAALQPLSDAVLLQRIPHGDPRAAEALMRRHNRMMYRTARAILRDDAEAEDAVQDAYIQAFRAAGAFRGDSSVSTWLVRIVANQALMRRRRNMRRAEVIPFAADAEPSVIEEFPDNESLGPEREASNAELRALLERHIDNLPDVFRPVFMMRAVEEMTVEETAAALGLPEATVRTRFFRARALLRGSLERDLDHALGDAFAFDGERCDRIVARVIAALA